MAQVQIPEWSQYLDQADKALTSADLNWRYRGWDTGFKWVPTDTTIENKMSMAERMYQNDYNLAMWNLQNEYNSPSSQLARMTAAGVNPYAAAQQVNGGNNNTTLQSEGAQYSGRYNSEKRERHLQNINTLLQLMQQSAQFADSVIGMQQSRGLYPLRYQDMQGQVNSQILDNDWKGLRQALLLSYGNDDKFFYLGDRFGLQYDKIPKDYQDYLSKVLTPEYYNSVAKYQSSQNAKYDLENIKPLLREKFGLQNQQLDYMVNMIQTLPPEMRAIFQLLISLK